MGILDSIMSKLGRDAKRKAKNATQKTTNETINKAFK